MKSITNDEQVKESIPLESSLFQFSKPVNEDVLLNKTAIDVEINKQPIPLQDNSDCTTPMDDSSPEEEDKSDNVISKSKSSNISTTDLKNGNKGGHSSEHDGTSEVDSSAKNNMQGSKQNDSEYQTPSQHKKNHPVRPPVIIKRKDVLSEPVTPTNKPPT